MPLNNLILRPPPAATLLQALHFQSLHIAIAETANRVDTPHMSTKDEFDASYSAPIKNTAGEGFAVEDKVGAWLACHILAGVPWPNQDAGSLQAINCQMRQENWKFDDFVLEIDGPAGAYRCGSSVKSFPVLGKEGAPLDFRQALWSEWRRNEAGAFNRERDILALFCAPHEPDIRDAWQGMLEFARSASPATLAKRVVEETEPSKLKNLAFKSLSLRGADAATQMDPLETAQLIQRFHLQEQDFDRVDSQSIKQAQLMCQHALVDSDRIRAIDLWRTILGYTAEVRNKGGRISLETLLPRLAGTFRLKHHPHYATEWQQIASDTSDQLLTVPTRIGGVVAITRDALLQNITAKHKQNDSVALLGNSGNGKTVVAHEWATENPDASVVWVRAAELRSGALRARWSLTHDLPTLFLNSSRPIRLVLDGLDKCFEEEAFAEAAILLKAALALQRNQREIVLTCCPDDWERIQRELIRRGIALKCAQIPVGVFSDDELRQVRTQLPQLGPLWQRPHLRPILRWPKVLDIAATYWRDTETPTWTSESDFARWFWQTAICQDNPVSDRGRVLRKLATNLADRLTPSANCNTFAEGDLPVLMELARERLLTIDALKGNVRIEHELVADWARLHELHAQSADPAEFLRARLQSPMWHRSLRFFALDLLEHDNGAERWKQLFQAFLSNDSITEIAHNLLLEAPVFALHDSSLESLWPLLAAENGVLLKRFLRQFLRAATLPDERYVAHFREKAPEVQLEASVRYRLPWAPYWFGVIKFLHAHRDEVVTSARAEVADACLLWLQLHPAISRNMDLAADIAVTAARAFYRSGDRGYRHHDEISPEQKVCAALLASAPIAPVAATELALKLSGRMAPDAADRLPPRPVPAAPPQTPGVPREAFSRIFFAPDPGEPRPWPEGPIVPCHDAFREAFMDSNFAAPFISAVPEVAAEVLFAVLLDIPHENSSPRGDHHLEVDEWGFQRSHSSREATFWTEGPFLTFLRLKPDVALPAIIRLVNFATDRALEIGEDIRQPLAAPVVIDGKTRSWGGHQHSYHWHEGHVFGPRAAACALMSLEKWLYLLQDEGASLDQYLDTIMQDSRSIALGSVLVCLGKRHLSLFLGKLKPLLACAEFHWLAEIAERSGEGGFRASSITGFTWIRSSARRELVREWVEMPHRKTSFSSLVLQKFFTDAEWRLALGEIQSDWQARIANATPQEPAPVWLPRLAAPLNVENWRPETHPNGTRILFEPPADLPKPTAEERHQLELTEKLLFLPHQCSRILDGETNCSEEQMQTWWDLIPSIRQLEVPADDGGLRRVEDALCGIVAVAVVCHREWLRAEPKREADARKILLDVSRKPPPRFWFVEGDITTWKWDVFAAWALTTFWVEDPPDDFLRHSVAVLAMWDRHMVVDRVMRVAAKHRERLGKDFELLFAHTVHYAPVLHRARMERHAQKTSFDVAKWRVNHSKKFLRGRTPALPMSWREVTQPQPRWRRGGKTKIQSAGMDFGHLAASMAWMADLDAAQSASERMTWIKCHRESLLCVVQRMDNEPVEDESNLPHWQQDHQEKFPYQDEEQILKRAAAVLARLKPGEEHALLWKPVFSLGHKAPEWIERFVNAWLLEAVCRDQVEPVFQEQWLDMLQFSEESAAWKKAPKRSRGMGDTRKTLLGLSFLSFDTWRTDLRPAVKAAQRHFDDWARTNACRSYEARDYLHFLRTPAAEPLRFDGLLLLREQVPIDNDYFWKKDDVQDAFAQFLKLLLDEHWSVISCSQAHREAFMHFGLKLTALQHAFGSELLALAAHRLAEA